MKQSQLLLMIFFLLATVSIKAQVGIGTSSPAASAQLEVSSTTKGFLPPRMTTTERNAIASPADGLVIFNTTTNALEFKTSIGWVSLSSYTISYPTPSIKIGDQNWMDKNLDVTTYRNGDIIPQVTDPTAWAALTTGAWCYYNNDPTTGATYGKLYNGYAVNDPRGLAPQGWHIPSDAEWTTLGNALGGEGVAGGKMKEIGTVNWASPNTGATNESAFAALPGGGRDDFGSFNDYGYYSYWWGYQGIGSTNANYRFLKNNNGNIGRDFVAKKFGFSVRCLRD